MHGSSKHYTESIYATMKKMRGLGLAWVALAALVGAPAQDRQPVLRAVQTEEQAAGLPPTGNFARLDPRRPAYYRCYFTGKLELPDSYDGLKLREGAPNGCRLSEKKYDVFFYPIEAVASRHTPVTQSLAAATPERFATVVSHEDFHAQIHELPDRIAEAAATLAGFVTGAAALSMLGRPQLSSEADLFLEKSTLINRSYERLRAVYQDARERRISRSTARTDKRQLLDALQRECRKIRPAPQSFNPCVSAPNNAGLAFDHTYTADYPLIYAVFQACRRDLRCTTEAIVTAPKKRPEAEVAAYFRRFVADHSPR